MKILFCVAFILLSTSHLSFAQQVSQSALQQLEARLANEIKLLGVKIDEMDKRLNNRIDEMDKRINNRIDEMDKRIAAQFNAVTAQFNAQESKISMVQWTLGLLIVVIVAVLALPQAVSFIRERRGQEELSELRETVKQVTNDMGVLKQQMQKLNEVVLPPSKQA